MDKWVVNKKIYETIIGADDKEFAAAVKKTAEKYTCQINTAATTKLEFQYFDALLNQEKSDAKVNIPKYEREYGARFRIRKEDFVQAALLKKRLDYLK